MTISIPVQVVSNAKVRSFGIVYNGISRHPVSYFGNNSVNRWARTIVKEIALLPMEVIAEGVWAIDPWSNGYFHWFIDVLQWYYSIFDTSIEIPLILPHAYKHLPFITSSLD